MNKSGTGTPGETKIVKGVVTISNGRIWLPYPETAHDLIKMAQEHGWGFDDGLPVRQYQEGTPFVRILIGRGSGENALIPDEIVPGTQFHITWRMPNKFTETSKRSWILCEVYRKTTETETWESIKSLKAVRAAMSGQPVMIPNGYVPAA